MKKLLALLFLFPFAAHAQNSTDELLDAKKVRNYVHFSVSGKKLYYQLDGNTDKKSHKTFPESFCIAVPKSDNEVALVFDFINPFKQKVILTQTMEADGAYESLSKFYSAVKVLSGQLSGAAGTEIGKSDIDPKAYKSAGQSDSVSKAKKDVAVVNAKSLTAWKYSFLNNDKNCIKNTKLFDHLINADRQFYLKADDFAIDDFFPKKINKLCEELASQPSVATLIDYSAAMNQEIANLDKLNNVADGMLSILKNWDYSGTFDDGNDAAVCASLRDYTKEVIDHFLEDANVLLEKRKTVVATLKEIKKNIDAFLIDCDAKDNTMIVGRVPVSVENVKIQTIKLRDVQFASLNNEIKVTEDEKNDVELGKIRIRNYHLLIPEFSLGAFYTDLAYPVYGVNTEAGVSKVGGPLMQNYSLVAAASLNLVVNLQGLLNPMLQLGVGSAKELPSFLAGGGLRLSKPNHLSVSFGGLWTWKKELDKLKVGDVVLGSDALDADLKFRFITKPSFYLGLNFGF